ncbi:hypothetical protein Tco_0698493 [Tanacetum coccineum]
MRGIRLCLRNDHRLILLQEIEKIDKFASMDIIQKAHVKWDIEGDENSKFFHGLINKKRRNHDDQWVLVEGKLVLKPSCLIKDAFLQFYKRKKISMLMIHCYWLAVKELVDRFHMRLSSWKANLLLIGGRLTHYKSVLGCGTLEFNFGKIFGVGETPLFQGSIGSIILDQDKYCLIIERFIMCKCLGMVSTNLGVRISCYLRDMIDLNILPTLDHATTGIIYPGSWRSVAGLAYSVRKLFRLDLRRFEMVLLFILLSRLFGVFIKIHPRSENRWLGLRDGGFFFCRSENKSRDFTIF